MIMMNHICVITNVSMWLRGYNVSVCESAASCGSMMGQC